MFSPGVWLSFEIEQTAMGAVAVCAGALTLRKVKQGSQSRFGYLIAGLILAWGLTQLALALDYACNTYACLEYYTEKNLRIQYFIQVSIFLADSHYWFFGMKYFEAGF